VKQENSGQQLEREVSSGVIVFRRTREGPRYLVLYHGRGYWNFPKGKIEKEERSFEAALRETYEETGIGRTHLRFVHFFKTFEHWTFRRQGKKVRKTVIFYLAETTRRDVKLSEDSGREKHYGYAWVTYREALQIFVGPRHSENHKVIRRVHDLLAQRRTLSKNSLHPGREMLARQKN
jgi:8-oxo-dGTP pyrophosphatase MutT (NUDIX family)